MSDYNDRIIAEFRANGGHVDTNGYGSNLVLLHSIGVRSGHEHVNPVMSITQPDGSWLIAASNAGGARNPAWYGNLTAHPDISVEAGTETLAVTASPLDGDAYTDGWAQFTRRSPAFAQYQERAGERRIPVVKLTPR
jgi:deazaflavin-dependent oxidoreductase (nitroreductase family)